ncbi:MAG TPA: class I SAM-dependent methyltransferase [Longimicrobiales bacterium]|nr:class I SAM-dependent methyltransferase [Longimicrobiales bacterium]
MDTELFELHADIEEIHWWFVGRRRVIRRLLERVVPPGRGKLVVDVGCGTGANIAGIADGYRALGVDPSADAIREARRRFRGVEFRQGFAPECLGEWAGRVDALLLMDVLEHVPDDFELFSGLVASLRPGAQMLVTVPADMRLWSPHDETFQHYRRYDRERLALVFDGLPVRVRLLSHFNARLYPVVRAMRAYSQWRRRPAGEEGTDLWVPRPAANRALTRVFAGEAAALLRRLDRGDRQAYPFGVSLIAVLERLDGACDVRTRPRTVAEDPHDPRAKEGA